MKPDIHLLRYLAELFLVWESCQTEICRSIQNTSSTIPPPPPRNSCRFCGSVVQHGTARPSADDNIIRRMRIACRITEATDTHSEYVILIAFPRQHWLRKRASLLRYAYIAWLVIVEVCYCWSGLCCDLGTAVWDLVMLKKRKEAYKVR